MKDTDVLLILLVTKLPLATNELMHYTNERIIFRSKQNRLLLFGIPPKDTWRLLDHFCCMVHIRSAQASSLPSLGMTSQFHIQPRGNIFHFIRRHPTPLPQPIVSLNRSARSLSNGLRITAGSLKHSIQGVTLFCGMEEQGKVRGTSEKGMLPDQIYVSFFPSCFRYSSFLLIYFI